MQQFGSKNYQNQASTNEYFIDDYKKLPYEFFLKVAGLLSTGVNLKRRYAPVKINPSYKLISSIYCRTVCAVFWFFTFRTFILMFIDDENTQIMMGDITGKWNSYRMYFLMPAFFLSFQTGLICWVFLKREHEFGWIVPFLSIRQMQLRNERITMDHSSHLIRINLGLFVVWVITLVATGVSSYQIYDTAITTFDRHTFRIWIPWMIFQIVWIFYVVYINYLVLSYFNLICLVIKKRFATIGRAIEELADSDPGPVGSKNDQINQLYFDHNEICELVEESNNFWQTYIFCTFMTYIPCACYVLYNLFFAEFDIILHVFTWSIFLHTVIILFIICVSAADVSSEAHSPYTALHTISLLQLPIDLEINMSTFLHRVRGPTIGYSCLDLFVVTNSSISNTIAAVASYFLIVADFSRSTMTNRYRNQQENVTVPTTIAALFQQE